MNRLISTLVVMGFAMVTSATVKASIEFEYSFNLYDAGADTPYFSSNAFLRKENFYGTDSVRYWQPASPKFDCRNRLRGVDPVAYLSASLRAAPLGLSGFSQWSPGVP